jgi:hypothetical protein
MRVGLDLPRLAVDAALGRPRIVPPASARPTRYLSLVDELKALRAPGRPRPAGAPGRARILRDVAHAALARSAVLDPPPRDPLWIAEGAAAALRRRARRLRQAPRSS